LATTALVLAIILFIAGLAGTILPILPGAVLIYAGMLLYGFLTDFNTLNAWFFFLQAIALIIVFAIDYIASAVGTRRFGGSSKAAAGAIIGTIVGLIVLGPLGIIIGPFVGATSVELLRGTKLNKAARAGFGTLVGILGGTVVKLCAEIIMIIYFFMRI